MTTHAASQRHQTSAQVSRPRRYPILLLIAGLVVTTLFALVVGNGHPLIALAPTLVVALVYALCKLPLSVPALTLMVLAFLLEIPGENFAMNKWASPFAVLGALLFGQLKGLTQVSALVFTGLDLLLLVLFSIHAYRRATGARIDKRDAVLAPQPLVWAAVACLAGCAFAFAWGMLRGGTFRFSLWQLQRLIYLPLVFLLFQAVLPNPLSYRAIGRVILVCAAIRAGMAIYIRSLFPDIDYTTTHADSMLFAVATAILIIGLLEIRTRRVLLACLVLLPTLVWGMIANDRRLVWVELGLALLLSFVFARRNKVKVQVARFGLALLPVLVVYVAAGWNSGSALFAPVGIVRSVVDSGSDTSTQWRDLENFNLVTTIKHNPVLGTGFGHPYEFAVELPDVTKHYELEPYAPHNSVLGLWAYTGYVGFALLWMMLIFTVYFAMRSYKLATDPEHRTAALACFCAVIVYMVHLYGDMALGTWVSVFLISSAMVVSGKLAVLVGAWPGTPSSSAHPEKPDASYSLSGT